MNSSRFGFSHPRAIPSSQMTASPHQTDPNRDRWTGSLPTSQFRSNGYISPDPSSTTATPLPPDTAYPFPPPELYNHVPRGSIGLGGIMGPPKGQIYHPAPIPSQEVDPYYYPEVVTTRRKSKGRKMDGKQATFLTKLYSILEQRNYRHMIRWDDAGEIIIIERPDELTDTVLPMAFRQTRFASFSRQLNIYGFMRKVSLRHIERGIIHPDASTWSHPFLRRDSPEEDIIGFKRRVPPRPSQSTKRKSMVPEPELSPTSSETSYHSPPDAYHNHLLADLEEEPMIYHHSPPQPYPVRQAHSPEYNRDYFRSPFPYILASRPIPHHITHDRPPLFRATSHLIPQSAPPNAGPFPIHHRVTHGHVRTRSVQGEPPSATLFSPTSPTSPLARPSWIPNPQPIDIHNVTLHSNASPPSYDLDNPSSWVRRGLADLTTGSPIPYVKFEPGCPASVPSDFAPLGVIPPSFSAALSDDSLATISPGILSQGFGDNGIFIPGYIPSSPRAVPRHERRDSVGPYSPRSSVGRGGYQTSMRGEDMEVDRSGQCSVMEAREVDEALPSASLRGLHPAGPFEGILGGESQSSL